MKFLSGLLIFCFSHLLKIKSIKHNTIITTITIIAVHTIPAKIPSKNAVASVVANMYDIKIRSLVDSSGGSCLVS